MMYGEVTWSPGLTLADIEERVIKKALQHYSQNKTHTANALGISVRNLQYKLNSYEERDQTKGVTSEKRLLDAPKV